jgi:RNA recognition motif-containing protein
MKIFITGLPLEVGEDELTAVFGDFGPVKSLRIIKDRDTGVSRGFGFVEMPNDDEAREAIKRMNGGDYNGHRIKVAEAIEKPNTGGNAGGGFKRNNRTEKSY